DRPAAREDAAHLARPERHQLAVDEAAPPLSDSHDLPAVIVEPPYDRSDHGVQAGTVAAAGENSCAHGDILETDLHWTRMRLLVGIALASLFAALLVGCGADSKSGSRAT